MDYLKNIDPKIIWAIIGLIILIQFKVFLINDDKRNRKLKKKICRGNFISAKDFNKNWILKKQHKTGYKYKDTSGCYVILVFDKKPRKNRFQNYKNVYIGQSINVMHRVHQHFTGHGNGDIYADVKYGKKVYVQIVPCKRKDLNDTEIRLIQAFDATRSYNKTKGGSKVVQN